MRATMRILVGIAFVIIPCSICAQDAPTPFPPKLQAAWKPRTIIGWMAVTPDQFTLEFGEGKRGDLPAFQPASFNFADFDDRTPLVDVLKNRLIPEQPFGLDLTDWGFSIEDADFKALARFKQLQMLKVGYRLPDFQRMDTIRSSWKLTDAGLEALAELKELRMLDIHRTQITGKGLKELARLKNLEGLRISRGPLADAALKHIGAMPALQWLDVS